LAERKEKKAQLPIGIKFENLPLHYPAAHKYKKKQSGPRAPKQERRA
jgi:hypothetical protein